jgi:hypothetical protein
VAATGHNRCIIPLKPQNLAAWLAPGPSRAQLYALLDDRERPYYTHELAAWFSGPSSQSPLNRSRRRLAVSAANPNKRSPSKPP